MVKIRELRRRFELDGPKATVTHFTEALHQGLLRPEHSAPQLAEGLVPDGSEWVRPLTRARAVA